MSEAIQERRTKRSADPLIALHYQLAQVRDGANLDVLVLAEPSGLVVAGAGSWPACEELAAYAPFFVQAEGNDALSLRVESMRPEVEVLTMVVDGQEMLLCARGGRGRRESVALAAVGVTRILRAA